MVLMTTFLKELGVVIPGVENELKNRIFLSSFSKIEGNRIDPMFSLYWGKNASSSKYENISLHSIAHIVKGNALSKSNVGLGDIPVIAGGKQVHISIIKQTIMEILSPLARLELMRDMFGIMITLYMRLIVV